MRNSCKIKKQILTIFCLLYLSATNLHASKSLNKKEFPIKEIFDYMEKNDTVGLSKALVYLNGNTDKYLGKELMEILQKGAAHSESTDLCELFGFYSLIRKHYALEGNTSKAMEYALKSYNIQKNKKENEALYWLLIDIGNIYYEMREYDQAQNFYSKAIKIATKLKDMYGLSVVHLNMGLVDEEREDYKNALKQFRASGFYRNFSENKKLIASSYSNIANVFFKMKEIDSAFYYIQKAEHYYHHVGTETDLLIEIPAFIKLGYYQYYASFKDYEKAAKYLVDARDYMREHRLLGPYIGSFYIEYRSLMEHGMYEKAIAAIRVIFPLVKDKRLLLNERDLSESLAVCYNKLGRYKEAAEAFANYMWVQKEIDNSSMKAQFNTVRAMAEVHESDVKLNRMKRNMEIGQLNNEIRKKQRNVSFFVAGLAILGILVLIYLIRQLRIREEKLQKLQQHLKEQNNSIKLQSNELKKSNQIKDKIFSVIAHDLRNPLNRLLAELAIIRQEIPENRRAITRSMENTLKETIDLFERLLQWSKRDNKQIVYSPSVLSLTENVNKIIVFYQADIEGKQITVTNNCEALNAFVDVNVLLTLLRNLMGNAIKAVGDNGKIRIDGNQLDEKHLEIIFSDSGCGFSASILGEFNDENKIDTVGEGTGLMLCKMLARYNGWPIHLSNDSIYGGAKITLVIPSYVKKYPGQHQDMAALENIQLSEEWKEKLEKIKKFKIYQTSELRQFLNAFETSDVDALLWINSAHEAIHAGNNEQFQQLLKLL